MWPSGSGSPHPLDELVAGATLEQRVGHPVDAFGAGQLSELFGQPLRRLLAKPVCNLPPQNHCLTLPATLPANLPGAFLDQLVQTLLNPLRQLIHRPYSSQVQYLRVTSQF